MDSPTFEDIAAAFDVLELTLGSSFPDTAFTTVWANGASSGAVDDWLTVTWTGGPEPAAVAAALGVPAAALDGLPTWRHGSASLYLDLVRAL